MNLEKLQKSLLSLGYKVNIFENRDEACDYLVSSISNTTVGFGGSVTLEQLGLFDKLSKNNQVFNHWKQNEVLKQAGSTDVYLSSVNGISEDGEIINIDGTSNRVSSILYGHNRVIFVLGINKIAENYEKALDRARNIAAVKNAIRLNKKTPCTITGKCMNCKSPDRICRSLSVLWDVPGKRDYEVVIIKEELGY